MKKIIKALFPNNITNTYRALRDQKQKKRNEKVFAGNAVTCPICNATYSLFGPYGVSKRENARCHNCGSLERDRLIYLFLQEKVVFFNNIDTPVRVLHFAPEKPFYDLFTNMENVDYTPCDLFPEVYPYKGKTKITKVDITQIPFEDNSFDFVLCNHVLEHVIDDRKAMRELHRVLNKNGNGIFQVPIDYKRETTYEDFSITSPKAREKAFGQDDHVRWYGKDYVLRLQETGFKVNEDRFITTFNKDDLFKYGLSSTELIYHCKK